nr:MAG: hypothetical protein [White spot syndrome virus]
MEYMEEGDIAERRSEGVDYILDENSACVVNVKSIRNRLGAMDAEEAQYAQDISAQLVTHIIRLAHCSESNKIKDTIASIAGLFINNIFDNNSTKNKLKTYNQFKAESQNKSSVLNIFGSLDPLSMLSSFMGSDPAKSGGENLDKSLGVLFEVLQNYNPCKIDDIVLLEMCPSKCAACTGLKEAIRQEQPMEAMLLFFKCINHNRFNFGSDIKSAYASETCMRYSQDERAVVVPLRSILLGCLDRDDPAHTLSSFGDTIEYADSDNAWVSSLFAAVSRMPMVDRAVIAHFYVYTMLSRHRRVSGDSFKQFVYTVFVRMIYSAIEILFCDTENSSVECGGKHFLSYVNAMVNVSVLGSTFNVLKAYRSWVVDQASVAPILDIISGGWKKNYPSPDHIKRVAYDISQVINHLASPSRMVKGNNKASNVTSGLDSIRSVRQAEKYIPFGILENKAGYGVINIAKHNISRPAREQSNGRNFNCNALHILPSIKGCEALGAQKGSADQTVNVFDNFVASHMDIAMKKQGSGKILGLLTSMIDRQGLTTSFPSSEAEYKKRIHDFTRYVIFSSTPINDELVNSRCILPHSNVLNSPISLRNIDPESVPDTRFHFLLMMWQRPNIDEPNLSALTTSQLELLLSKNQKWDKLTTRAFFNIDRINFQMADAIIKNVSGSGFLDGSKTASSSSSAPNFFQIFSGAECTAKQLQSIRKFIGESMQHVQKEWSSAVNNGNRGVENYDGLNAQFSEELFELLYKLIIEEDMRPSSLIASSEFLSNYVNAMDELLIRANAS